jgi:programmed cell death protein 5
MSDISKLGLQQGPGGNEGSSKEDQAQAAADRKAEQENMKNSILSQILDQTALARLNTLRMAKPERAAMIESILINMMRTGQLRSKISEDEFVDILNRVPTSNSQSVKVKFERRQDSSDEEDFMKDL